MSSTCRALVVLTSALVVKRMLLSDCSVRLLPAMPVPVMAPDTVRLFAAPRAVSAISPDDARLPATVNAPAWALAAIALAVIAPSVRLPAACVMARLPVEFSIPAP